jgi:hypothetical protein
VWGKKQLYITAKGQALFLFEAGLRLAGPKRVCVGIGWRGAAGLCAEITCEADRVLVGGCQTGAAGSLIPRIELGNKAGRKNKTKVYLLYIRFDEKIKHFYADTGHICIKMVDYANIR